MVAEKSGLNIPYGGWGRVQPTFGEVYGAQPTEKTGMNVPYAGWGRVQPTFGEVYGASVAELLNIRDTTSWITGFLVGAGAVLAVGWYLNKKPLDKL